MRVLPQLLVLSCVLLGCQEATTDYFGTTTPRHPADTLWINNGAEPESIDPGKCTDSAGGSIIDNLFAGLSQPHPADLTPMPELAARWEVSADGRHYTFFLRDSVWSDGTPCTAEDFAWSWKRVLDPKTASRYASLLHVLEGGAAFNQGALSLRAAPPLDEATARQALADAQVPVERWQADDSGLFAFLGGAEADKAALTARALRLDGAVIAGHRLQVHLTDASQVGVRALDAHTLDVRLQDPAPYFLNLVGFHVFMPVPRHLLASLRARGVDEDLWTRPEHMVSNGPYVLGSWRFKHAFTYEKNPRYWNGERARVQHVKVLEIENVNTALNMYRVGELDWIGASTSLPSEFLAHLQRYKDVHRDANLSVYFYWLNTQQPPLDDVRVRRALSLAIDREALTRYITRGGQIPTADLVPDKLAGYAGLMRPLFDPEQARALLRDAGYGPDKPLPRVSFIYNTSESHKQIAEAVQAMWKKHLGIDVEIENQEWKVFLENTGLHNFQIARMAWTGDYPDPNTFLHDLLTHHAGNNLSGWADPRFDALLEQANRTLDPPTRLALLRQAEALAMQAQPLIPLYVYTRSYVRKPYLKGFWPNFQDRHALASMWIDPRWYSGVVEPDPAEPPPGH